MIQDQTQNFYAFILQFLRFLSIWDIAVFALPPNTIKGYGYVFPETSK
jgi:hypothetical protein